ncbi:MAG: hypothetical protein WCE80_04590 [Acidimicrobiia bacterium]
MTGGLILAWGTDYPFSTPGWLFVLGIGFIVGLMSVEFVTSSAIRERFSRSMSGHIRQFVVFIVAVFLFRWLLDGFKVEASSRELVADLVAWALIYTALAWAARRARHRDAGPLPNASDVQ